MDAFELDELERRREAAGPLYHEFLRVPSMSAGVYELAAGSEDPQSPHEEDEIYYVASGRATVRVGDEDRAVRPGSVVYVPARVPHRFHAIEEELCLLVLF